MPTLGSNLKTTYNKIMNILERYLPAITVFAFIGGIALTSVWASFGDHVQNTLDGFIGGYGTIAPMAIFFILAPSLYRMLSVGKGRGGKFVGLGMVSFSLQRLCACIFGVILTGLLLGLPFFNEGGSNVGALIFGALKSLGKMMIQSPYFFAVYASIAIVLVALKVKFVSRILNKCSDIIEVLGQALVPIVPIFMLGIGSYIYTLPANLEEQLGGTSLLNTLTTVHFFGLTINPTTPWGMISLYLLGAGLTGIICILWHCMMIGYTKIMVPRFLIKTYFSKYWIRVYPLLWSTSSEALATPLNLYLVKKHYGWITPEVRRFVVGMGSFASINGTMICVFALAGVVGQALGLNLSIFDLLLCIPLAFIIGFGVPGIPGELLLFGGPIVALLGIPEPIAGTFLTLYLGLQIGLPDSFRTGNNSTDNCLTSVRLNQIYNQRYAQKIGEDNEGEKEVEKSVKQKAA